MDKSLPFGFCAGSRVFVFDNLAFRSELVVSRRHTRFGKIRFAQAIVKAIASLSAFQEQESVRIRQVQAEMVTSEQADSLILRSFERKLINSQDLPRILREWRQPTFEEHREPSRWNLFQAFTRISSAKEDEGPFAAVLPATTIALSGTPRRHHE